MLRKPFNSMKIKLYRMRVKGRKVLRRNIVCVAYKMKLRVTDIKPYRNLAARYKVYGSYPWHAVFNSAEKIFEDIPVTVSLV